LFATFHTAHAFLNRLTGPARDSIVLTPEYKVVAVRIEKLAEVNAQIIPASAQQPTSTLTSGHTEP
jgi:predicted molibdopterin-dependent oxidoreductase YjgC